MSKPRDDLFAVLLLLLGVFAFRRNSFTGAEAANVDTHADVSAPGEICVLGIIPRGGTVIFAIGKVLEQGREFLFRFSPTGYVQRRRQADSIFHRNPRLLHAYSVNRGRRRFSCKGTS